MLVIARLNQNISESSAHQRTSEKTRREKRKNSFLNIQEKYCVVKKEAKTHCNPFFLN